MIIDENKKFLDDFKKSDNSFRSNDTFMELLLRPFGKRYNINDMRKAYETGIDIGFDQGIHRYSYKGQRLQLRDNIKNKKHEEFYQKFLELSNEYNIAITYHPLAGMIFIEHD